MNIDYVVETCYQIEVTRKVNQKLYFVVYHKFGLLCSMPLYFFKFTLVILQEQIFIIMLIHFA